MNTCKCGCNQKTNKGKSYISGHNLKNLKRTKSHREKIAKAQKKAWKRTPNRLCFGRTTRKPVGSKAIDSNGYVLIKHKDSCKNWRLEHILVIEKALNRDLEKKEVIHHINGDKRDNSLENLLLCENKTKHGLIERTFKYLLKGLINDKIVEYDRVKEKYVRKIKKI